MDALVEVFGEPISVYSRAQAIEDGVLVDVSSWAGNGPDGMLGGFKVPVAFTQALWSAIQVPKSNRMESVRGRAHDVLWMGACAGRRARGDSVDFRVMVGRKYVVCRMKIDGDGIVIGLQSDPGW